MKLREFLATRSFLAGQYEVLTPVADGLECILNFTQATSDEQGARNVGLASCPGTGAEAQRAEVFSAAVRAGARHPGLLDEELAKLHRAAQKDGHIELFADLNALKTGLLVHLIYSLGRSVARVIVSSSSIDVLHEYQSRYVAEARIQRAGMVRGLRTLERVREIVPVHIHQLEPGASRYYKRIYAQQGAAPTQELPPEESLYISEDRQMMAAFWDYQTKNNPRIPVYLITSDFNLAHVSAAERAPFLFCRTPFECWRDAERPIQLSTLWFDPFALSLRTCLPHFIAWELCLTFGKLRVLRDDKPEFDLIYNYRVQRPGEKEEIEIGPPDDARLTAGIKKPKGRRLAPRPTPTTTKTTEATIKIPLLRIVEVLPTRSDQRTQLRTFGTRDEHAIRQLRQLGEMTGLYRVQGEEIDAGPALDQLLAALSGGDYLLVNKIFRRHPTYDKVLKAAEEAKRFPNSAAAGAATGWAVILGAGYKTKEGVLFGLADVSAEKFEGTIVRFHNELGEGQPAAPLPHVLDRTCRALQLSPIRFSELLARSLGRGALAGFEAQRATVDAPIPSHQVLVAPSSTSPKSYLKTIEPGKGIEINRTLVSSLVRRPGRR
jgi:hypothetical protein